MNDSWIANPLFENYWSNYHKGQLWYLKHRNAQWEAKVAAVEYENQNLHWLLQNVCQCQAKYKLLPHPLTNTNTIIPEFQNTNIQEVTIDNEGDTESNDENIEMEIPDEMLDFFVQSMKHKQERRLIDDSAEVEYINEEELPIEARSVDVHGLNIPDPENVSNKFKDYENLYGRNAPRIQAMETAMQCTFHRICDRKQPKFWPNMPLKP